MIIVLCGKSASGKNAIAAMLEDAGFTQIVTTTSRPMRDGEVNYIDYNFVTKQEFEELIANDKLIEYRSYNTAVSGVPDTWYYGVQKTYINKNRDHCIVLTPDGISKFVNYYGRENCYVVYVDVPDSVREQRAMQRGSFDSTEWNRRLAADAEDFSDKKLDMVDLSVDNTGKLASCVALIIRKMKKHKAV